MKQLTVFDHHRLKIAKQTLRMNPAMINVVGGMTVDEAKQVIYNLTGKRPWLKLN